MSVIPQSDRWIEFFRVYRQLPALWCVSAEVYKNQRMKKKAFDSLLECYKNIDSKANVDSMRRKINSVRTCFRRELRKVEHSELMAKKKNEVYVPQLWYFNELSFLRENDTRPPQMASTMDTNDKFWIEDDPDEEESINGLTNEDTDNYSEKETKLFEQSMPVPNTSAVNHNSLEHLVEKSQTPTPAQVPSQVSLNPSRDEADIYAEGWATSYRKLDETNKLLAKKAIEEILVLGQLNKLMFNAVKMPN